MKKLTIILLLISLSSCSVLKKKETQDKSKITTETERKTITREPSKVVNETQYNIKYKDTIIERVNYETKTVLREVYDNKGNRTTECICDGIREDIETIKQIQQNDITARKETSHDFNPTMLVWAFAALIFVIVLFMGVFLYIQNKAQKTLIELINSKV